MKEYCVDLELAKELKENGFPQKGLFYFGAVWDFIKDCNGIYDICGYDLTMELNEAQLQDNNKEGNYFAPTSDEILKELKTKLILLNKPFYIDISTNETDKVNVEFYIYGDKFTDDFESTKDKKLSNTLAKMWLYLKKEGFIK